MTLHDRARQFRERAHHLRRLAETIEATPAMALERYAGDDTWSGARAQLCRTLLMSGQQQLFAAADDLRAHAWRLEREADELDVLARAAG